jgi:hypothetical protein
VRKEIGCELVSHKCKVYSLDEDAWGDCRRKQLIPDKLGDIQEGIFVTKEGERLRSVTIFNVPIGEERYVEAVLKKKAKEIAAITRQYAEDLEEDHPHELWALLYYSLQYRVTYWLRTCTPEEI